MAKFENLVDITKLGYYDGKLKAFVASKYVAKADGKTLTSNDFTDELKAKYDKTVTDVANLIVTGGQANVIEKIKVNGVEVAPDTEKAVNVTVPTTEEINTQITTKVSALDTAVQAKLDNKVDKVEGKGLSTEDYTTADKTKVAGIEDGAQVNKIETITVDGTALPITAKGVAIDIAGTYAKTADLNAAKAELTTAIDGKVAKEEGKGLSTNDFTTAEKTKLAGMDNAIDTAIATAIGDINHFILADELPAEGTKNAIYLIPKASGEGTNVKDEYCFIGGKWEHIGDTAPDLSGYVKEDQITFATNAEIDGLFAAASN